MKRRHVTLAVLVAGSIAGTALIILAGGGDAVVGVLRGFEAHRGLVVLSFAAWALVANCLVLPAGSLSLIAGGALLGTWVPAAIWFAAQLATAPLLFRAAQGSPERSKAIIARYLGQGAAELLGDAVRDGFWTTVLLRLTPILPSAPACLIASAAGIDFKAFMAGSVAAGWVRPLYFASLGAAVGSLARIGSTDAARPIEALAPLIALAASAALLLAARIWALRRRRGLTPAPADVPRG